MDAEKIGVYLSSPYEHDCAGQDWKVNVDNYLYRIDDRFVTVDPCPPDCLEANFGNDLLAEGNYLEFYKMCANIVESDFAMLKRCEGMIAYLPANARTVGTIHEIIYSLDNQIPVVMVMPEGITKASRWLWGILGPGRIFDDLELATRTLADRILVARGEKLNHV